MIDDNQFSLICAIVGVLIIAGLRGYQSWRDKKNAEAKKTDRYIGPGDW